MNEKGLVRKKPTVIKWMNKYIFLLLEIQESLGVYHDKKALSKN